MKKSIEKLKLGYCGFKSQYGEDKADFMKKLATQGQSPEVMVVSCCDSRVDPGMLFQCKPGDLFIARNVANIIPPYEKDTSHHGISAALEFGVCYLKVKHLIILGHSQCGGICALLDEKKVLKEQNDFLGNWLDIIRQSEGFESTDKDDIDTMAKNALTLSYNNCLTFPWIKHRIDHEELTVHRMFFDINAVNLLSYNPKTRGFESF